MNKPKNLSNAAMVERLNVLLIVSSYLPNFGGLQTVTSTLAGELARRGHRVAVLTNRYPRTLPAFELIENIPVTRWHFLLPRLEMLKNKRVDLFLASLFYFPVIFARLIARIAFERPDIINLHFVGAPAPFLLFARRFWRFRLIISFHGDDVAGLQGRSKFDRWVVREIVRRSNQVTTCSNYLLAQAQVIEPSVVTKCQVVYNALDDAVGEQSTVRGDKVIAVGRLVHKKGMDVLINALARRNDPAMGLQIIGHGEERSALERLTDDLNLRARVEFLGARSHAETIQLMAGCRFVVIPSRQEPFGMVALEAMGLGKAIVATRAGGLPEILQDADAILVEPENPLALAEAMRNVWMRLEREPSFGARNREYARRFSPAAMAESYLRVFEG